MPDTIKTLLLVEPDHHYAQARAKIIESIGYYVVTACSSQKAQEIFQQNDTIHLVSIDIDSEESQNGLD